MRYVPYFGVWKTTKWYEFSVLSPGNVEKSNVLCLYQSDKRRTLTVEKLYPVVKRHISICLPKAYCVFYLNWLTSSLTHPPISTTVLFDSSKHGSPMIWINTKTKTAYRYPFHFHPHYHHALHHLFLPIPSKHNFKWIDRKSKCFHFSSHSSIDSHYKSHFLSLPSNTNFLHSLLSLNSPSTHTQFLDFFHHSKIHPYFWNHLFKHKSY